MDDNKEKLKKKKRQQKNATSSKRSDLPKPNRFFPVGEDDDGGDVSERLVGSIIEKGISDTLSPNPTPPPQLTVLPFPVARHRSHGPHWGPVSCGKDGNEDGEDNDDDDFTRFDPFSAFANPVKRKQKKGLEFSQWKEIVAGDNSLKNDEVGKNGLGLKKNGEHRKDGGEGCNMNKKNLLGYSSGVNEGSMEVDAEEEDVSSSMPPAMVGESVSMANDMEIDNVVVKKMERRDPVLTEGLNKQEQLNSSVVSISSVNNFGNEQVSTSLENEINAENRARLQNMSPEEIAEAQAELMAKLNPALLDKLKNRGQKKLKQQNKSRSDEAVSGQLDNTPIEQLLTRDSRASPHVGSEGSDMMTANTSKDRKNVVGNNAMHNLGGAGGSLWNTWIERVEAVRGLRFYLDGTVLTYEPDTGDISSNDRHNADDVAERDFLRTEGDPGAAGYTIKEAVQLTRSVIPGQRALALHLLASVLDKAIRNIQQNQVGSTMRHDNLVNKSIDWEAIWAFALGPEPELVLALRICLDDNHNSVVLACAKVIQCVLSCDLNENFFEISEKIVTHEKDIFTAPVFRSKPDIDVGFLHGGFWKYNAKPSNILASAEDIIGEGEHTIQDDIVVACQDFAAGLVRMGILPRMRYLLEADPTATLEECIISILVAIARHSPVCATAIMKCHMLIDVVVRKFTEEDNAQVHPSKIKSIRLLRVLAQSDKKHCIDFIKNGTFQAMTWHLYRYTSSLDNWMKSGKEICKLSSALMVEELRFWKVCIHYGCCISYFSDMFPALCLWLNPPTFMKLQENNVLGEFASVSNEAYLVLEALGRKLPNFYAQKHPSNQVSCCGGDEPEAWSWSYVTPMVDSALKWITSKSDPYVTELLVLEKGTRSKFVSESSASSLLWVYSAVLHMLSTLFNRVVPEDTTELKESGRNLPWLPEFVPKVGLEIVRNGFLGFLGTSDTEHGKDFVGNGTFVDDLCHFRQHSKYETSLASVCCLHGLIRVTASIDNLIQLAKSEIHSPLSQGFNFSREGKILEDGILKGSLVELRSVLDVFMKLIVSEWPSIQSIETFGRGGPAPGVGIGWGASGGGFWSMTLLLAQTDAGLLILMLEIFQILSTSKFPSDEEMASSTCLITCALGVCLTAGPDGRVAVEKALNILVEVPVLKYLGLCIRQFLHLKENMKLFRWEYGKEDYLLFSNILASHFKSRWLSVKNKKKATDDKKSSGNKASKKGKTSLETIHEDLDMSSISGQDQCCTSLAAKWAHQRLPLPMHWFLTPISTITINKVGGFQSASGIQNFIQDSCNTLEVAKVGLFFLLGMETVSTFVCTDVASPVRCVPLVWKLHSLSVALVVGMGVLEDDKSRDVYEALQDLYGQLLDETRSSRSTEKFLEENAYALPETRKTSTFELLRFHSEIHESYSTFLEILVEQFAAVSYGDIIFGRQVTVYLHRCTEASVRLAAWTALANARVLEILPPLDKCFAEAEGYLEPVEDNELILEAYVKSWVSGALDRAVTRGSMAFTLVLHHISSFIFQTHANDMMILRNKLAKSLLRDYSKKQRHEDIMLDLVRYHRPLTYDLAVKREGLSTSEFQRRFEILVDACDRDSSLLAVVEKLKSAFVNKRLVN